ncbi:MAG: topoisomerase, partial [Verrucomicrobia bacterium]|nr:topoisomerase [Verrucomicrobiota bacterium]
MKSTGPARLQHDTQSKRGIRRQRKGHGFTYLDARGRAISKPGTLERIKSLAIPPAWENVWISPSSHSPLQATGRDARKRKQYLYHPAHRAKQERSKYRRILKFAQALPRVRRRLRRDLKKPGLGLEKVLATVIGLLDCSLIRVGNREYAKQNGSFGLTTLQDQHVSVTSRDLEFRFRGKSKKFHTIQVHDRQLAEVVRQCRKVKGRHLFQYLDDKKRAHKITSQDVNEYLRRLSHDEFSAKDFRTWSATVLMTTALLKMGKCISAAQAKRNLKEGLATVSERLGNTPAICRKSYIHPIILETYLSRLSLPKIRPVRTAPQGLFKQEMIAYGLLH